MERPAIQGHRAPGWYWGYCDEQEEHLDVKWKVPRHMAPVSLEFTSPTPALASLLSGYRTPRFGSNIGSYTASRAWGSQS